MKPPRNRQPAAANPTAERPHNRTSQAHSEEKVEGGFPKYCAQPVTPPPTISAKASAERAAAIFAVGRNWLNGTVIHFHFFNSSEPHGIKVPSSWLGADDQKEVVRRAFQTWKEVGIGLEFQEVNSPTEAEVRIGFMLGDGSWSAVGKDVLKSGPAERTMNFGWRLSGSDGLNTALHEIGHTLGLEHEHQNPFAGIVWDEEAVYAALAAPPNNWDRATTHWNIIRKIAPGEVKGSTWDHDSVMHYPIERGLIREPKPYDRDGVHPAGGLSQLDQTWVREFYPPLNPPAFPMLEPGQSHALPQKSGGQENFTVSPQVTRKYNIRTFGSCDSAVALFEEENGTPRYITADDDSGEDRNASLQVKLLKGRKYIVRAQVRYADLSSPPTIMMW